MTSKSLSTLYHENPTYYQGLAGAAGIGTTLGFALAGLISGSFIVEAFFGIPGVGLLAVESFFSRDYPVIMALVMIGTTAFALANLVVDLLYPVIDPRIRIQGGWND